MKRIVIAVLLSFIGPGLGQLYNREFKKGIILIIVTAFILLAPMVWIVIKTVPMLPDPQKQVVTQQMVEFQVIETIKNSKHFLNVITFVFLGVWAYSITQAYFKVKERLKAEAKSVESGDGV
jgi:hypothetical protein